MLFLITCNYALNSYGVLVDNLLGARALPEGQMGLCHLPKPKSKSWNWLGARHTLSTHRRESQWAGPVEGGLPTHWLSY